MHSWFPLSKLKRSRIVGKHFRQNIKPFKPKKLVMTSPTNAVCSFRLWGRREGGESGPNKNASCKQRGKSGGFVDPMEKNSSIQYSKLLLEVSV